MIAAIVLGLLLAFPALAQDNPVLVGTVIKVTDGDTIKVQLSSGPINVRFDSMDAPEKDQQWGREAQRALASLVSGREVVLEPVDQDRYDRLVAVVLLGDKNVNAWMVEQGHAWAYRQYLKDKSQCYREAAARKARRGLWSQPPAKTYAPWEWRARKQGRLESVTDYSGETAAACLAAMGRPSSAPPDRQVTRQPSAPAATTGSTGCLIKGNISKNGKIYHVPGSPSYASTKIDESKGERWFCTEEEASTAGWRPPRG